MQNFFIFEDKKDEMGSFKFAMSAWDMHECIYWFFHMKINRFNRFFIFVFFFWLEIWNQSSSIMWPIEWNYMRWIDDFAAAGRIVNIFTFH